jgi:DNA-3-methyladenine glycosylase II
MATQRVIQVDGPFSLAAAASFGFGPNMGHPYPDAGLMRFAFVADDLASHAGVVIRDRPDGSLLADISGDADPDLAVAQLSRILSLDADASGWLAAGAADPVLGRLQAENPGLRPVLFHSPYEAAVWAILAQHRSRGQALALSRRLAETAGAPFDLAGQQEVALPTPARLLEVEGVQGIDPARMTRLHGVAAAALDGHFDVAGLRAMPDAAALTWLQQVRGLGPFYSMLVYLRATGVTDGLALGEPRLAGYLRHYYGLAETPDDATMERLAEPWRPFRTWAGVLFRAAGERAGLPFEQRQRPTNRQSPAA